MMEFTTFCNICFNTENDIEENENASNILISFLGNQTTINKSKVYLCRLCCDKLEEYGHFRNMCTMSILYFRHLYFELKTKLESGNDSGMTKKLRNFLNAKVYNKIDSSVCDEVKTRFVAFTHDVRNTVTTDITDCVAETERDLLNVVETKVTKGVCRVASNVGNKATHELSQTHEHHEERICPNGTKCKRRKIIYECSVCNKAFTSSFRLCNHQRIHSGEKPYKCTVCNKAFTYFDNLKKHQRFHSGEKLFTCNVCKKPFTNICHLKEHERVHSGEKPYVCDVCEKRFAHLGALRRHVRVHSGDKPYACSMCDKSFNDTTHLREHQWIHTGHKPNKCNICYKAFTQLSYLRKHQLIHNDAIS